MWTPDYVCWQAATLHSVTVEGNEPQDGGRAVTRLRARIYGPALIVTVIVPV